MTHLLENDTGTEKPGLSPLQHLYLLPTAECRGRAGPGT